MTTKDIKRTAWKEYEDQYVVDTVLAAMRLGKSQLYAFDKAAAHLNRSSSAVNFRFNSIIRHEIKDEMKKVRQQRLANKLTEKDTKQNATSAILRPIQKRGIQTVQVEIPKEMKDERIKEDAKAVGLPEVYACLEEVQKAHMHMLEANKQLLQMLRFYL